MAECAKTSKERKEQEGAEGGKQHGRERKRKERRAGAAPSPPLSALRWQKKSISAAGRFVACYSCRSSARSARRNPAAMDLPAMQCTSR